MSTINFVEGKPVTMDVVAPRDQQPRQAAEWAGHASSKFLPTRSHVPAPVPNQDAHHPLYSMGARRHYAEKRDEQRTWKPSLVPNLAPEPKHPRKEGVKHIDYKPGDQKAHFEKKHLTDKHASLQGPTMDNPRYCMRPFPDSYKVSVKEYTQESTMNQKVRVKTLEE